DILETIVAKIKINPQVVPNFPPNTKFSLALITGSNDAAQFQFLGNVVLKIIREDKMITLSQNASGKLKESDQLSFVLTSGFAKPVTQESNLPPLVTIPPITNSPLTTHSFLPNFPLQMLILKSYDQLKSKFQRPKTIYIALAVLLI